MKNSLNTLTPAQAALTAYWARAAGESLAPRRADLNAGELRRFLGALSIVAFRPDGRAEPRLIGSQTRDLFGLKEGPLSKAWAEPARRALASGGPVHGSIRRGDQRHAWLRLPLFDEAGALSLALCHDELVSPLVEETDYRSRRPVHGVLGVAVA